MDNNNNKKCINEIKTLDVAQHIARGKWDAHVFLLKTDISINDK